MKIGFRCDHAAIDLKNELIEYMTEKGYECVDYGTGYDENGEIIKCDYPNKGREVGEASKRHRDSENQGRGIVQLVTRPTLHRGRRANDLRAQHAQQQRH